MRVLQRVCKPQCMCFVAGVQKLLKEGLLLKFSRKEPQPRMFFLVSSKPLSPFLRYFMLSQPDSPVPHSSTIFWSTPPPSLPQTPHSRYIHISPIVFSTSSKQYSLFIERDQIVCIYLEWRWTLIDLIVIDSVCVCVCVCRWSREFHWKGWE